MSNTETERFLAGLFGMTGKTAVVVGGTGVLCGAMAKGLWRAGCRVVLVGRDESKARAHREAWGAPEDEVLFARAEATSKADLQAALELSLDRFGGVDVWVNGAGVNSATPYLEIAEEEFERIVRTNLLSVHLGCQVVASHWTGAGRGGSIINLSSMSALRPLSRVFTYSLTKAAVWNLTQNLAREWAGRGIRVNALCPGFFPAEQNRKVLDKDRIASIMRQTPMDRFGEAEELVGATLLLASDKAGSFITGANLVVDGGFAVTSI
ncbi:putative oxidoreductase UxuB [Fundidesulfovibrio magnetotacticus]|uniref:Putative oxidoreductase UxuB n=1 Tax=Fundidesulfovibrio magnetotacticus TaxID=2730080 RepID=A0A6V8LYG4_9BACT|nr:SDR family oxidoreductase [Fundidesulfovibrio magnetotacticus]GFK95850.1 putative oxidoreductase UxuB [Fundidesulfovibrio magnetotacticus]